MNSIVFIAQANQLVNEIKSGEFEEGKVQMELDYLFDVMTNPTLLASRNLVQAAKANGYLVPEHVERKVLQFA
jgi:hypothetical protein